MFLNAYWPNKSSRRVCVVCTAAEHRCDGSLQLVFSVKLAAVGVQAKHVVFTIEPLHSGDF